MMDRNDKSVRKNRDGQYRVYFVAKNSDPSFEARYTTAVDAKDYIQRRGGYLCWEDFETKEEAQRFFEEKRGEIWW